LVVWFMSVIVVWFVVSMLFYFLIFSPSKFTVWPFLYFCFNPYSFGLYFFFLSFCKSFICFQLFPSILIYQIIYSSIWFLFFWFFELFIKLIFFSILHFNKKFVFIFYFNFYPHYLDSFFGSSYSIDFFFKYTLQSKIKFVLYYNFDPFL
jgi:hypothetical protein